MSPPADWRPIRPDRARSLTDARLQFHHAAQFATALGISYLPHEDDDSHTNLGWDNDLGALVSRTAGSPNGPVAIAAAPATLSLVILLNGKVAETIPLHGITIEAARQRIARALGGAGLDADRYTLRRHYEIPPHGVDEGGTFDAGDAASLHEMEAWYANASALLERIARETPGASDVRCWPHHFDIATLVTRAPGRTNGVGLSPGDEYYGEPYFYVNASPAPGKEQLVASLDGRGLWHTKDWIGAVLPGSRLDADGASQQAQAHRFATSALRELGRLIT